MVGLGMEAGAAYAETRLHWWAIVPYRTETKQGYLGPVVPQEACMTSLPRTPRVFSVYTSWGFGMQNCLFSHAGAIHFYIVLAVNCTGLRI